MAVLRARDQEFVPPDRCLVGRSRSCDLVLVGPDVSSQQAVLRWLGTVWELQDLGSRNGTWVGDVRLAAGQRVCLAVGALLSFGRESPAWTLIDAGAPLPTAVALASGERRLADGGHLTLPNAEHPELSVYQLGDGSWLVEQDGAVRAVEDRAVLVVAGEAWRLYLPATTDGTRDDQAAPTVAQLRLRFAYSRDEEHVELVALCRGQQYDLQARAHHYVLLTLARQRLEDAQAGVSAAEQGWLRLDELQARLRMSEAHLNTAIHRARAQLGKAGIADPVALVERRHGTRQVRLGVGDLELVALADG